MNTTKTVKIGQTNMSNNLNELMKDIISSHITDSFTILNIKPFKGIRKANCKRWSFGWKALWTSFDDIECSKTNGSQVYDLSFNKSRWKGVSVDWVMMACTLTFNFWYGTIVDWGSSDDDVVYVAKIPVPKVMNKMFFERMAKLVEFNCKELNNSGETIRWNYNWGTYCF